jgi:hypothetical protein
MIEIRFPDKIVAVKLLKQRDAYLDKLDQYNLDLYKIKDMDAYLKNLDSCPIEFSKKHKERIQWIQKQFNKALIQVFPVNNSQKEPLIINMIKSNGSECGLAYTRLNFIVYTDNISNFDAYIIHEMFHVISRQNPFLTNLLYEAIGFKNGHQDLLDLHNIKYILNPDAPINNYYLLKDGLKIVPYAENLGLKYKFLILDENNNIADLPENSVKEYGKMFKEEFDPITYIIHPEEIIAEIWTSLWLNKLNLKSSVGNHNLKLDHPLIKKMKNILKDYEIRS